jgi:2-polyprenyl-3-methyl-5-hydroxy-6-metoxy-1,4-benzoquinol methylase
MSNTVSLACPICRSVKTHRCLERLYDDRYGYPGFYDLHYCENCGHKFLNAQFSSEELRRLYTEFYPRSVLHLDQWRPYTERSRFRLWLAREGSGAFRWVPRNVKVLDVGCGFGESLGYHRSRGCDVVGIDADENIRRIAERFGFDARVGLFHAADFAANSFDFVTLDQVIEHAADPVRLLRDASAVLRPGGTVLLSTPNGRSLLARLFGRRWVHLHTPYHLQLFCRQSLVEAARAAGLKVVWSRSATNPRWFGFQWLHLLSRPAPGIASAFWKSNTRWPTALVPVRKAISASGKIGFNHLVSLILDAMSVGDNFVVALKKAGE